MVQGPSHLEEGGAQAGHRDHHHPVEHLDSAHSCQSKEPEPEEDVDLLVDDVEGEHADPIELLDGAGRTELVEGALGHLDKQDSLDMSERDLWEDPGHGVPPVLMGQLGHGQHLAAVGGELTAKEEVHEPDLEDNIHKVKELAGKESQCVEVVVSPVLCEVVDQHLLPLLLGLWTYDGQVEAWGRVAVVGRRGHLTPAYSASLPPTSSTGTWGTVLGWLDLTLGCRRGLPGRRG